MNPPYTPQAPQCILDNAYESLVSKQKQLAEIRRKIKAALKQAENLGQDETNLATDIREIRHFLIQSNPAKYRLLMDQQ